MYLNNNPHDSFFVFYKKKCVKSIRWNPDAIVFNSWQHYGCPNYWMLHFFKDSSGATLHPTTIQASNYGQLVASAITWQNGKDKSTYLRIKVNHRLIALLPCFPRSRGKKERMWMGNRVAAGGQFREQSRGSQRLCGRAGERHEEVWIKTDGSNIQQPARREFLPAAGEGRYSV
jgi:hypothetical protein